MTSRSFLREWAPTGSMMLASLVSYVDRNTLAVLSPTLLRELHLSAQEYGTMISCFSIAYTLGNPAWGAVLDRVGLRRGMLLAVAVWTIASASHARVAGFAGFALARAVLGFGEGATFPGGLRAATQTLPPSKRGRGVALAYSGGSLGAIVTPLLVTPIAEAYGWRAAFLATGLFGGAWLAQWIFVSRDPRLDRAAPPVAAEAEAEGDRVGAGDRRVWAFIAVYAMGGLPLGFVLYAAPLYLSAVFGQTQAELGRLLWLPPLGWEVGYFFFGWLVDARARRGAGGRSDDARFTRVLVALGALALLLAAVPRIASLAVALALFVLATFAAAGFIIVGLAYAGRAFSLKDSGLVAGLGAGSWSALVAVVMPLFGHLFDARRYGAAFVVAGVAPLLGLLAWTALAPREERVH